MIDQRENTLRLLMLADLGSSHTQRWAVALAGRGLQVMVVGLNPVPSEWYQGVSGLQVKDLGIPREKSVRGEGTLAKLCFYLMAVPRVKKILRSFRPDILHAHYATSYGFYGAITGFHPFVLTCWGSDVLVTPKKSPLHRAMVRFNLQRADAITSMAHHMTRTLRALGTNPEKIITLPFGVDDRIFHPGSRPEGYTSSSPTIICTRNFEPVYNISLLLRSLPFVRARIPGVRCNLVGDGSKRKELEQEAKQLGVQSMVEFRGSVPPGQVAKYLSESDVFCTLSYSDGNNVSLNEAMACGCFPVATRIPANKEWIVEGENGFLVPLDDPVAVAEAICKALASPELRQKAQVRNWEIIQQRGNWRKQVSRMEYVYEKLMRGEPLILRENDPTEISSKLADY